MCADKRQLNALEDEMLHMIQSISGEFSKGIIAYISKYTTVGNILDDEELIHALQAVKQAAVDVKERIANAQESQKMVDTHRQYFQPVCCMCMEVTLCVQKTVLFILDCNQRFNSIFLSIVAERSGPCLSIFSQLVSEDLLYVH